MNYIHKNHFRVKKVLEKKGITYGEFMTQFRKSKKKINSMADLRKLWGEEEPENPIRQCFRILSY